MQRHCDIWTGARGQQPIPTVVRVARRAGSSLTGILILLLLMAAGCAPKKVIPANTATPPAPTRVRKTLSRLDPPAGPREESPPQKELETETGLPAPQFLPRSGRPGFRTTPESLTLGMQAATLAREQMGKQYQWGAAGPDRFDCSGLAQYVFGQLGVDLPRVSRRQARVGQEIGRSELQPGDLVFFSLSGSGINHVGIYLDDGEFVHAPRKYMPVRTDSLNDSWWRQRFRLARRLP